MSANEIRETQEARAAIGTSTVEAVVENAVTARINNGAPKLAANELPVTTRGLKVDEGEAAQRTVNKMIVEGRNRPTSEILVIR